MSSRFWRWLACMFVAAASVARPEVFINEIMYHPGPAFPENSALEWVELFNSETNQVDLCEWALTGAVEFTFGNTVVLDPGSYLIISADWRLFTNHFAGVTNVVGNWTGKLGKNGQTLRLLDSAGQEVDRVSYASEGDWATRVRGPYDLGHYGWRWETLADGGGRSVELINPAMPHNSGQNWAVSAFTNGTPGRANSSFRTNTAPLILETTHFPAVPRSTESITITARVVDEGSSGVTVQLFYRSGSRVPPLAFTVVPMFDDGSHNDGGAGDGIYGAILPAQSNNLVIEFYLQASDSSTNSRTWPAAVRQLDSSLAPTCNALLQVDDAIYTGHQPLYRAIMTETERRELDAIGLDERAAFCNATMNGTWITIDGTGTEIRYNAGFRNRGHGSRVFRPNNMRAEIPNDRRWKGVRHINLNTVNTHTQVGGSALFQKAGVPMNNSRAVQVRVNNANLAGSGYPQFGSYAANEVEDSEFVANHFPLDPAGNLYRGTRSDDMPVHADLGYRGGWKGAYTNLYFKRTNRGADDWSDLINLCWLLTNAPQAEYTARMTEAVDVDNWLLYFAANTLVDTRETTIANGWGDDYDLYFGVLDRRAKMIEHDVANILNEGDENHRGLTSASLFRMCDTNENVVPYAAQRFMYNPDFAPRYYGTLKQLMETSFSGPELRDTLLRAIGDFVAPITISNMLAWSAQRNAYVWSQIPTNLSVNVPLPTTNGYFRATAVTVGLNGKAHAVDTRSVRINGALASWNPVACTWSGTANLVPGINRIGIQAFGIKGLEVGHTNVDVWLDSGPGTVVVGNVTNDTTWLAAHGPYQVLADVSVLPGATLTFEPGTTVYFGPGCGLMVFGQLVAEGSVTNRIRLTRAPGEIPLTNSWAGIRLENSSATNICRGVDFEYAGFEGYALLACNSVLEIEDCSFQGSTGTALELFDSAFTVQNSVFGSSYREGVVRGIGIRTNGYAILESNFIAPMASGNPAVQFSRALRPGPILQVLNNTFTGAGADVLRLDGCDALVEGNVFMHVHKADLQAAEAAYVVNLGDFPIDGTNYGSQVMAIRNLLYDLDSLALVRNGAYMSLVNNTVVGVTQVLMNFDQPELRESGVLPGRGALLDGNIYWNPAGFEGTNFQNVYCSDPVFGSTEVLIQQCIMAGPELIDSGTRNMRVDPRLANTASNGVTWQTITDDFALLAGSPAKDAGPNGLDMGGLVPAGASVSGEPTSPSASTDATLNVGGPGITHYCYRLNNGVYSGERSITNPIVLSNLVAGATNAVFVLGKNYAGVWQDAEVPTISKSWVVECCRSRLVIREVLARNVTAFRHGESYPDLVELFNAGGERMNLAGIAVTDDPSNRAKFVFPEGASLEAGQFLLLYADQPDGTPGFHLGFGLNDQGDAVYLYDGSGQLLDSVQFGMQLPDLSIGRLNGDTWGLVQPLLSDVRYSKIAVPTGLRSTLKINEWLADDSTGSDFIELYNPDSLPVNLSGLFLTDAPQGSKERNPIAALSFIPANGYCTFLADGKPEQDPRHLNFKLAPEQGWIGLFETNGAVIDCIFYGPQSTGISEGRQPSGSNLFGFFPQPTSGAPNPENTFLVTISNTIINLVPMTQPWRYSQDGLDLWIDWRGTNYTEGWWQGPSPGILAYETCECLPAPGIRTWLSSTIRRTTYFRTTFFLNTNLAGFTLRATVLLDDGALIFLNGNEVARIGMPSGPVYYSTYANRSVIDAALESVILTNAVLLPGTNWLAVEVHQNTAGSADVVWGMSLEAVRSVTNYWSLPVILNEVMAKNVTVNNTDGTVTDWVELYNPTTNATDLSDMSLSDKDSEPRRWIFPTGVQLGPGNYLLVHFDPDSLASTNTGTVLNTGFGLKAEGDQVYLFDSVGRGGKIVDSIAFGPQAADYTIGRMQNQSETWALALPTPGSENLRASLGNPAALKINEWMANPDGGSDWFEIFNPNPQPVDLSGLCLTDDLTPGGRTKSPVPALSFVGAGADGYLRFWADSDPTQGADHARFKLDGDGEAIGLYFPNGTEIDHVVFGKQQNGVSEGRFPDGATNIERFPNTATPNAGNLLPLTDVVINEVLTHSDLPLEDAIELHNPTLHSVDISGWYLTDNKSAPFRYRIPEGTILEPSGFVVFYEWQFNPLAGPLPGFALSSAQGDEVYLFPADEQGVLTGYRTGVKFDAAESWIAIGRFLTSTGTEFSRLARPTFGIDEPLTVQEFRRGQGSSNAEPLIGPVVISEIHYHPPDSIWNSETNDNTVDEYIELLNIGSTVVPLFDPDFPTNTWRLREAVDFVVPTNIMVAPGGILLVVSFDPAFDTNQLAFFRTRYGIPETVPIFGPWRGKLANDGESVELYKPDTPMPAGLPDAGYVPLVLVDKVEYADKAPWPAAADGYPNGLGLSLQRHVAVAYGNDPVNWYAGVPSPGRSNTAPFMAVPLISDLTGCTSAEPGTNLILSASVAGEVPLKIQWRCNSNLVPGATNTFLSLTNVQPAQAGVYSILAWNAFGAASAATRVDLCLAPSIFRSPRSRCVMPGETVCFKVTTQGTPPLRYQWLFQGTNVPGATKPALFVENAGSSAEGPYCVVISNSYGAVTSAVANLALFRAPSILTPPQSQVVDIGGDAQFTVTASGTSPFDYQWLFNGLTIPNATNETLVCSNVSPLQAGMYSVVVGNVLGSATSTAAELTVRPLLSQCQISSSNSIVLTLRSTPQCSYVIEASTNLLEWSLLATITAQDVETQYSLELNPSQKECFYRLRLEKKP